jgi:flagellar biogenesis protein FliO
MPALRHYGFRRALACAAMVIVATACGAQTPVDQHAAATTPPLPAYPDQAVPSVYFQASSASGLPSPAPPMLSTTSSVTTASHVVEQPIADVASERDRRRLGPSKNQRLPVADERTPPTAATSLLPEFGLPLDSIYTTGTALAIVLGLFLLCAWTLRRGGRKSVQMLPAEVVSVLGRVPLAGRQFAQLVRVGNKLVLLSITPSGVERLTEITDPVEIDRVLGLCLQRESHSSTSEFDDVFRQLAKETPPEGFLGREATPFVARSAADAYSAYRGGAERV